MKRHQIIPPLLIWILLTTVTLLFKEAITRALRLGNISSMALYSILVLFLLVYLAYKTAPLIKHSVKASTLAYRNITDVLGKYKTVSGELCFTLSADEEDHLRKALDEWRWFHSIIPWKKPLCFHTLGFRPNLYWVDIIYFRLLADLERIGFDVVILVHDEEFVYRDGAFLASYLKAKDDIFSDYCSSLEKLLEYSSGFKIAVGREYIQRNRRLRNRYIDLIYSRLIPYLPFVFGEMLRNRWTHDSARNEIINLVDSLAVLMYPRRQILLSLYFIRQATKWQIPPMSTIRQEANMILLVSDIVKPKTQETNVYDAAERICILDDLPTIRRKVYLADSDTLKSLAYVLLNTEYSAEKWFATLESPIASSILEYLEIAYPHISPEQQSWAARAIENLRQHPNDEHVLLEFATPTGIFADVFIRYQVIKGLYKLRSTAMI